MTEQFRAQQLCNLVTANAGEVVETDVKKMQAFATELHIGTETVPRVAKIESLHGPEREKRQVGERATAGITINIKSETLSHVGQDIDGVNRSQLLQNNDIRRGIRDHIQNPVQVHLTVTTTAVLNVISHDAGGGHPCLAVAATWFVAV
jgi:hypothetical protein